MNADMHREIARHHQADLARLAARKLVVADAGATRRGIAIEEPGRLRTVLLSLRALRVRPSSA
jgi:hypothetical protein